MNYKIKKYGYLVFLAVLACVQCYGIDDWSEVELWRPQDLQKQEEWMLNEGLRTMASVFYQTDFETQNLQHHVMMPSQWGQRIERERNNLISKAQELEKEINEVSSSIEWQLCLCNTEDRARAEKGWMLLNRLKGTLKNERSRYAEMRQPSSHEIVEYAKKIYQPSSSESIIVSDTYCDMVHEIRMYSHILAPLTKLRDGLHCLQGGLQPKISSLGYPSIGLWPQDFFHSNGDPVED